MPDRPDPLDPYDRLSGVLDLDVTVPDAADVRARGDRLRRRRTTLTALGAAASVALVAGVIGVVTSPGDQVLPAPAPADVAPAPSTSEAATDDQIPAGFPIAAGIPEQEELVIEHDLGASVAVCDQEIPNGPALDMMRAFFEQPRAEDRVLHLYSSGADARAEVKDARAAVARADCFSGKLVFTPVPYDRGDASFAFTDSSGYLFRLVTVGRALLFVATFEGREASVVDSDPLLQPVIEAMTIFSDEEALPPDGPSAIPQDFPLDIDQVAMEGDGGEKRGPSPDETGLNELTLCGAPIFADDPAERLASTATGPEYADIRELRVYPTADEAAEQITLLRARISTDCSQPVDGGGRLVNVPIQADTGYDTVTWADYYTQGLGGGPVQFTRVGRAVLAVALSGEFSEASLDGAGETVTEVTLKITPAMCVFTEDGCGGGPSEPEYLAMSHGQAGPFVLGMLPRAVRKQATTFDDSTRCATFTWEPDSLPHLTGVVDPDQGVVSLSSPDKRFLTSEGVEVGATYAEVLKAYPDATGDRSSLVAELGGASYRFELTDDRVTWIALVASDQSCVS